LEDTECQNIQNYMARPNMWRLEPGEHVNISSMCLNNQRAEIYSAPSCLSPSLVSRVETLEPPLCLVCKDRILIQSTVITPERSMKALCDIFTPGFHRDEESVVCEQKVSIAYLPPLPADEKAERRSSLLTRTVSQLRRVSVRKSWG
jgi:hypothetical protein